MDTVIPDCIPPQPLRPATDRSKGRAAVAYRRLGWDTRPARVRGKLPVAPWSLDRSPAKYMLNMLSDAWDRQPELNIAILTGSRSRLVVVDVDQNAEKYATSVAERLELLYSAGWPRETCVERTGGGGLHLF